MGWIACREVDEKEESNPYKDQEDWEKHQLAGATLKFGAKQGRQQRDEYEFVFEDQIDFIKTEALAGNLVRHCRARNPLSAQIGMVVEELFLS